jgi:hypothetical protein
MDSDKEMEYEEEEDEEEEEDTEGVPVEKDFLSNPYVFDPVLPTGTPLAPDVQGATGKPSCAK